MSEETIRQKIYAQAKATGEYEATLREHARIRRAIRKMFREGSGEVTKSEVLAAIAPPKAKKEKP